MAYEWIKQIEDKDDSKYTWLNSITPKKQIPKEQIKGYDEYGVPTGESGKRLEYYNPSFGESLLNLGKNVKSFFKSKPAFPVPGEFEYETYTRSVAEKTGDKNAVGLGFVQGANPLGFNLEKIQDKTNKIVGLPEDINSITKAKEKPGYTVGNIAGNFTKYGAFYSGLGKGIEAAAKPIASKITSPLLKNLAVEGIKDLAISTPLSTLEAVNSGKRGSELAKDIAGNVAMDIGANTLFYGLGKLPAIKQAYGEKLAKQYLGDKYVDITKTKVSNIPKTDVPKAEIPKAEIPKTDVPEIPATDVLNVPNTPVIPKTSVMENIENIAQKPRQFIDNSVMNSKVAPDELKQTFEPKPMYTPISEQGYWQKAQGKVQADYEGSLNEFLGKQYLSTADDTALGEALIVDAIQKGDIPKANSLSINLAEKATSSGQTVQAFAIFKKLTPEGMLQYGNKKVQDLNNDVLKKKPDVKKTLNEVDELIKNKIGEIDKTAADKIDDVLKPKEDVLKQKKDSSKDLEELTTGEKFAERVDKQINALANKTKKTTAEKELLKTLTSISQKRLPPKIKTLTDPTNSISLAIKNMDEYQQVWQEAKKILSTKYGSNPEKLELFEQIFETKLRPVFYDKKLSQAIELKLKQKDMKMSDFVKQSIAMQKTTQTDIVNSIAKNLDLTKEESAYLEHFAFKKLKELTSETKEKELAKIFAERKIPVKKNELQRLIEYSNLGGFYNPKYRNLIAQKLGLSSLTDVEAKYITQSMQKIQGMSEGDEKDIVLAQVLQLIANKSPATTAEKIQAVLRVSMLFNPKTLISINPLGNVVMTSMENLKQYSATAIDKLAAKKTGVRTVTLPQYKAQYEGTKKGLRNLKEDWAAGVDTTMTGSKYELPRKRIFEEGTLLNWADQKTRKLLQLGDAPFSSAAYADRMAQLKKLKGVEEETPEMIADSINQALERTYQNQSGMVKATVAVRKAINIGFATIGIGNEQFGVGNLILPFVQTPANITAKALEYSPFGLIKAVQYGMKMTESPTMQRQFVETLGRVLTGSAITAIGYFLAKNKLATGERSSSPKVARLEREAGINEYALKFGDTYATFEWAQPASISLAVGIALFEAKEQESTVIESLQEGFNTIFKQGVLQGISKLLSGYNPAASITNAIIGSSSQLTPTVGSQAARIIDPYERETGDENRLKYQANILKSRIPLLRQTLPIKKDILGNDIKANQGKQFIQKAVDILLTPGRITTETDNPVLKEMLKLYEATGETTHIPTQITNSLTENGKTYALTNKEKVDFQSELGKYIEKELNKLLVNKNYTGLTNDRKQKIMGNIVQEAYTAYKIKFMREKAR